MSIYHCWPLETWATCRDMALNESWIQEALQHCVEYSWVYDFKMTRFFLEKPWTKIPPSWLKLLQDLTVEELNSLPIGLIKDTWPESFKTFCHNIKKYSQKSSESLYVSELVPEVIRAGMKPKKLHEIGRMTSFVYEFCKSENLSAVVDIGCGLGYLGNSLTTSHGLKVFGFDSVESHCQGAVRRSSKVTTGCVIEKLQFDCTTTSAERIYSSLNQYISDFDSARLCMVGLHCCGDLTPDMLKQFCNMPIFTGLVCVGCCYHKLKENSSCKFRNFPMSSLMKAHYVVLDEKNQTSPMTVYGLRLACQDTSARWQHWTKEEHTSHTHHVAYRAVLEYYSITMKRVIRKTKRQLTPLSEFTTFDSYVSALMKSIEFQENSFEKVYAELCKCFKDCEVYFTFIEIFTALQFMLQGVLESLILHDRLLYMQEMGLNAKLVAVFDERISPRNVAVVAWKAKQDPTNSSLAE